MVGQIKEIDAMELARWRSEKSDNLRVIDVREPMEFNQGMIPGADPMPMQTVPAQLANLEKEKELVVVCRSGARSAQVCVFLQQQGFDKVYNLRGGMMGWSGSGQQVAAPSF